ncbi:tetrathionate respiration response regulator TtrR [Moellerella wisconsensis]|uniref:Tetrathionate reductase two-component response regulator n=2 Tax=Moellerella wisconsensis TaxID=158849 RepID=A0A0N0Z832_9GAMM|nr:tetrathionate respiration response regulator TtrR [Moellerella wisconsensis]KPD02364.1 tetrathionate reductase two-component response regulator [Moellerella wisconsensis ATCC 35017]UNH28311.1 response regulator [Moellerella wisconsensis]UNH39859.1 response regulator [Moellerella wisconsensis]WJW82803.1 tetrathionate respiration response regulator TtrR [Moellerella wisconsensis]VFS54025.1 Transcriptional regulatory protein fixJ [Moellerella wisconsensis]
MPIIHLVDDDPDVTDACQFLLETLGYESQVWNNSKNFIENVDLLTEGIVLLDMRMPEIDGRQVYKKLLDAHSTLAVIFLSAHGDIPMAVEQMKFGAIDFLQKPIDSQSLINALAHAEIATRKATQKYINMQRYHSLTPREKNICAYVIQGMLNREIADVACVSVRTVEVHRSRVMEKMAVKNIAELVNIMQSVNI